MMFLFEALLIELWFSFDYSLMFLWWSDDIIMILLGPILLLLWYFVMVMHFLCVILIPYDFLCNVAYKQISILLVLKRGKVWLQSDNFLYQNPIPVSVQQIWKNCWTFCAQVEHYKTMAFVADPPFQYKADVVRACDGFFYTGAAFS